MQDETTMEEEVEVRDPSDPDVFDTDIPTSPNDPTHPDYVPIESIPQDTNPLHVENEDYQDYVARVPDGVLPASDAEWANGEVVPGDEVEHPPNGGGGGEAEPEMASAAKEVQDDEGIWGSYNEAEDEFDWNTPVDPPRTSADMGNVTASPSRSWRTDSYMTLGDGSELRWNGQRWVAATE